jgi:hypothetical protein
MSAPSRFVALVTLVLSATPALGNELVRMHERYLPGYQYHVSTRVQQFSAALSVPTEKDKQSGRSLSMTGESRLEYDERILDAVGADVRKTLRIYRVTELKRRVGPQEQENSIRQSVRRLVVMRHGTSEVPFSPDGPLMWGEIDIVRTDVFTPALAGLLPDYSIRPGDRWKAGVAAVQELTDFEKIDDGMIECRFEQLTTLAGRRAARITLAGTVRGVNEDGPGRMRFDGSFYFDLESNHLCYLTFEGTHELLDSKGNVSGTNRGRFTMTRQAHVRPADLSDDLVRRITTEPTNDNTLLLFDNPEIGVRFLYPRRWRLGTIEGRRLILDESNGSGLVLTLDPVKAIPATATLQTEAQSVIRQQQGRVLGSSRPTTLQVGERGLEQFALEAELSGRRVLLDYYVMRQRDGGGTIHAHLRPDDQSALRADVERIARSVVITKAIR